MINGMAISSFTSDKDSIYENKPAYNVKQVLQGFRLKGYIEERAMEIARYIIDNNTTKAAGGKTFRDQQEYGT